jgi:NAD(P)H dehydrogenase (quinone)
MTDRLISVFVAACLTVRRAATVNDKPTVLVLGSTGQLGGLIASELAGNDRVRLRVTSRRDDQLDSLRERFSAEAVSLDLDDPRTFPVALAGVDVVFLVTGYTVDMLVQSKALVDGAVAAGVRHIVHLGVFTPRTDLYDAHLAWHQLIEVYIKASGIPWTFLHPNCFMQNWTGFYGMVRGGVVRSYSEDNRLGWIALEDVAEAAAVVLADPAPHEGKDYWFSTEAANIVEIAEVISDVTGRRFTPDAQSSAQFIEDLGGDRRVLDAYFLGVEQWYVQLNDGRMDFFGEIRDDLPLLIGRPGTSIREWVTHHRDDLLALAGDA